MTFKIDKAERLLGESIHQILPVNGDLFVSTATRIIKISRGSEVYNALVDHG